MVHVSPKHLMFVVVKSSFHGTKRTALLTEILDLPPGERLVDGVCRRLLQYSHRRRPKSSAARRAREIVQSRARERATRIQSIGVASINMAMNASLTG